MSRDSKEYLVGVPSEEEAVELIDSGEVDLGNESHASCFRAGYKYCLDIIAGYYLGGADKETLIDRIVHESLEMDAEKKS